VNDGGVAMTANVTLLSPSRADDAVGVLCDAFRDYPVMRYILGAAGDYDQRLRTLIGFFVAARLTRDEPIFGVHDGASLVAVSLVVPPGERPMPAELVDRREAIWRALGAAERARYEAFGAATRPFEVGTPHYHLSMIGVRRSHAGRGLARVLLDQLHELAEGDAATSGVTLTTETPRNLPLYEHFGYRNVGRARVSAELETWGFYRPNGAVMSDRVEGRPGG
jgi:GNAT superfamily N-acetyltransferase